MLNFRELARGLGEKGIIVFSDVEHVILKGTSSLSSFLIYLVFNFE